MTVSHRVQSLLGSLSSSWLCLSCAARFRPWHRRDWRFLDEGRDELAIGLLMGSTFFALASAYGCTALRTVWGKCAKFFPLGGNQGVLLGRQCPPLRDFDRGVLRNRRRAELCFRRMFSAPRTPASEVRRYARFLLGSRQCSQARPKDTALRTKLRPVSIAKESRSVMTQ